MVGNGTEQGIQRRFSHKGFNAGLVGKAKAGTSAARHGVHTDDHTVIADRDYPDAPATPATGTFP